MKEIPTAKDFLSTIVDDNEFGTDWIHFLNVGKHTSAWESYLEDCLKRFAELHVQAALESAAENVEMELKGYYNDNDDPDERYEVNENSILNAYPLENIK